MDSSRSSRVATKKSPVKNTGSSPRSASARTSKRAPSGSRATKKNPRTSSGRRTTSRGALFLIDLAALRSRTRRRRLIIASLILLVGAFFAAALVQAQLVQTQAEADRIQAELNRLENDLALLDRQVVEASSPEVIVERARRLGMVRAVRPVYLVATRPVGP